MGRIYWRRIVVCGMGVRLQQDTEGLRGGGAIPFRIGWMGCFDAIAKGPYDIITTRQGRKEESHLRQTACHESREHLLFLPLFRGPLAQPSPSLKLFKETVSLP